MRVVIDTNVFISSFFGGNPKRIIDFWKNEKIILCLSKEILDEYIEVLKRIGLEDESELEELLGLFSKGYNLLFTTKTPKLHLIDDDPDDNKFIECAVALKAKAIVTGDKALRSLGNYKEIQILTPAEFLSVIMKWTQPSFKIASVEAR